MTWVDDVLWRVGLVRRARCTEFRLPRVLPEGFDVSRYDWQESRTTVKTPPQIIVSADFKRGIPCS